MEFDATFIVSAISFIVFSLIMNKIFYKPILDIMEKRQQYYADNLNVVKENSKKTDKANSDFDKTISSAKKKSKDITVNALNNSNDTKSKLIENAKISFEEQQRERIKILEDERQNVEHQLENSVDEISNLILSKILKGGKNV